MKQRVVVQAIIQNGDDVLLLRRSQGKPGSIGKYELPGGSIDDNEQPEDALKRHLHNELGIEKVRILLDDVVSMNSRQEGDIQHIFVVYIIADIARSFSVILGSSYDEYEWVSKPELQRKSLRDSAAYLLSIYRPDIQSDNPRPISRKTVDNIATDSAVHTSVTIYSDGGSRGNPGPSAAAFVIVDANHQVIDQGGEYLGITTNNQAEYHGVRLGLEKAAALGIPSVEFKIDSMLVVNQLNQVYKIKNRELWPINERIIELLGQFNHVRFVHVSRDLNKMADGLVNKLLDQHQNDQV